MTGLFCEKSWNELGADGAFYGRPVQLWYQIAGILTAIGIDSFSSEVKRSFSCLLIKSFCWWLHSSDSSSIEIYNWNSFIT